MIKAGGLRRQPDFDKASCRQLPPAFRRQPDCARLAAVTLAGYADATPRRDWSATLAATPDADDASASVAVMIRRPLRQPPLMPMLFAECRQHAAIAAAVPYSIRLIFTSPRFAACRRADYAGFSPFPDYVAATLLFSPRHAAARPRQRWREAAMRRVMLPRRAAARDTRSAACQRAPRLLFRHAQRCCRQRALRERYAASAIAPSVVEADIHV
jgi:hypothetical protein